jgi:predicted GH43/DUF377 family glycosyl hydrolase
MKIAVLALALAPFLFLVTPAQNHWQIGPFTRPVDAPVITPNRESIFTDPISHQPVQWEGLHTFNPAATVAPDGSVAVLYRAEDDSGSMMVGGHTSRIGLATSTDGLHFTRKPVPVLFMDNDAEKPHEYPGGVEDPRIVQSSDGLYILTYTQYARDAQFYDIGLATSRDLEHWTKRGPIFSASALGADAGKVYKSAGVVTELRDGKLVAVQIEGKYWMYWGEITIRLATSPDLLHWTPVLDPATHAPRVLLSRRSGKFDSGFPETGPPPILTKAGIVMLYNAKNGADDTAGGRDRTVGPGAYSVGEALFDAHDPARLLARTDKPVFRPERPFERTGQYTEGTTFAEGLIAFHGQWLLYYGTADSFVGVATAPLSSTAR